MPPTQALARFLARSRWEDLPEAIRREAKRALLNVVGCIIAGRSDPALAMIRAALPDDDAVLDAAAATAHDYDDTHLPTVIHASPPVAAALLSLARRRRVSGRDFLHALVLGMETSCRMGNAVMPGHYEHGWHITSTCGVFGAAAAASKLLDLTEKQIGHALALAATQAAGLVEVLGSMARVLNAGFAARNGIASALLAGQGIEGPQEPIAGRRGFVNVFGGSADLSRLTEGLGERWEMAEVAYKPYPSGVVLHALIDAVLEHRAELARASSLTVRLHPLAIERTDRPEPRNAIEARLSAQHAVAVALLYGRAGLAEFSDAAAVDAEVQAMRGRVKLLPDAALDKMAAAVSTFDAPRSRRMDDARLEAKFRELAGERAASLLEIIGSLEAMEAVPALISD
jgi:2-methylcitrate dehydratase PrpD